MSADRSIAQDGLFVPIKPRAASAVRLYAFPHAGGGPGSLAQLAAELPASIELWALNLPGRQSRLAEPCRTDLAPLVAELAAEVAGSAQPFALFGYCGGALLAYLVARHVQPCHLVVSSFAAPDLALIPRRLPTLPSELFWKAILDEGGVPNELAERTGLRPVFEPALRADFGLYASYRHNHDDSPPLDIPITVLHGRADTSLTRGSLLGWQRQSTYPVKLREVDAGHWLVEEAPHDVAVALAAQLMPVSGIANGESAE
jgi:surfactin synthase thioesterase subunit